MLEKDLESVAKDWLESQRIVTLVLLDEKDPDFFLIGGFNGQWSKKYGCWIVLVDSALDYGLFLANYAFTKGVSVHIDSTDTNKDIFNIHYIKRIKENKE